MEPISIGLKLVMECAQCFKVYMDQKVGTKQCTQPITSLILPLVKWFLDIDWGEGSVKMKADQERNRKERRKVGVNYFLIKLHKILYNTLSKYKTSWKQGCICQSSQSWLCVKSSGSCA
jgi:hypothetical protein